MGDTFLAPTTASGSAPRTFFSSTSANEFFGQLQTVLAEQHAQTQELIAQLAASQQAAQRESMAAINTALERLVGAVIPPGSPQGSTTGDGTQRTPPSPIPAEQPERAERPDHVPTEERPHPERPHPDRPNPDQPARETTAFTLAETTASTSTASSNTSGIRFPTFHGKDGEDVIAWLDQAERFFRLKGTAKDEKVDVATFALREGAKSFFRYCFTRNNRIELTWDEFKHAFTRKYDSPLTQDTLLRQKLRAVPYLGPHDIAEYCEKFREIESQIMKMEFPDRLEYFLAKLPSEAEMLIRGLESIRFEDMEVVYQAARQWAINARISKHREHHWKPLL
jgi:hypothetical protein